MNKWTQFCKTIDVRKIFSQLKAFVLIHRNWNDVLKQTFTIFWKIKLEKYLQKIFDSCSKYFFLQKRTKGLNIVRPSTWKKLLAGRKPTCYYTRTKMRYKNRRIDFSVKKSVFYGRFYSFLGIFALLSRLQLKLCPWDTLIIFLGKFSCKFVIPVLNFSVCCFLVTMVYSWEELSYVILHPKGKKTRYFNLRQE